MLQFRKQPVLAGCLSGILYSLVVYSGLGLLFLFLPTVPLFFIGLQQRTELPVAIAIGAIITAIAVNIPVALIYLLLFGLPTLIFCQFALRGHASFQQFDYTPVGLLLTYVTGWMCALITVVALYQLGQQEGLSTMLSVRVQEAFTTAPEEYRPTIGMLADKMSFLLISLSCWVWAGFLYLHAILAQRLLEKKQLNRRNNLTIAFFTMPLWVLQLLLISALASVIGSTEIAYLGKTLLVILLFPYALSGAAWLHMRSKDWPSRIFLLSLVYILIIALLWPIFILSGLGIWQQLKGLSSSQSSSIS